MQQPIDAVITWVDGHDAKHQEKLQQCLREKGVTRPQAADPTRYNQVGEIDYCVRAILKFAPWIRTIFIVTDEQIPALLLKEKTAENFEKIKLVDHRDIFQGYESSLPIFNSLTIESFLWRIEGLSERFIYFNDDCFLLRPVEEFEFFRGENLVLRGYWKTQKPSLWRNKIRKKLGLPLGLGDSHRCMQENAAKLAGFNPKFFYLPHMPFPLRKSYFANFYEKNPQLLTEQLLFPFRDLQQYWPISLMIHEAIANQAVCFVTQLPEATINGAIHNQRAVKQRLMRIEKYNLAYTCLQSLDLTPLAIQQFLLKWLDDKIAK